MFKQKQMDRTDGVMPAQDTEKKDAQAKSRAEKRGSKRAVVIGIVALLLAAMVIGGLVFRRGVNRRADELARKESADEPAT